MGRTKEFWIERQHFEAEENMRKRSRSPSAKKDTFIIPPVHAWTFSQCKNSIENGLKSVPLFYEHAPICIVIENAYLPFEPSSFDPGATRKNIILGLTETYDSAFACFEAALVHEVAQRRLDLFGESDTSDIIDTYKPITKQQGDYPRNLRVKMNTTGVFSVRYWDEHRTHIDPPETLVGTTVNVRVLLRALWIAEDAWGIVADCTDLQLAKTSVIQACPF